MTEFARTFIYVYIAASIVSWAWFPEFLGYTYRLSYDKFMAGWSSVK